MIITRELYSYQNGNVRVILQGDGTKIREYEGTPLPEHPESIDMKITDWCDAGCPYCHESSTTRGQHASIQTIMRMVNGLQPGVEIAIGGGDPLSHPDIETILSRLAEQGLVPNVTINGQHIYRHCAKIKNLRERRLLYGLGVSFDYGIAPEDGLADGVDGRLNLYNVADRNTIVHFIAGVDRVFDALALMKHHPKILILGYKDYGRGVRYRTEGVDLNIKAWRYWWRELLNRGHVCFDNLALEQLGVKNVLLESQWREWYMGDDGKFTMYADAVRDEFAVSSTSPRLGAFGKTAKEFFRSLRSHADVTP